MEEENTITVQKGINPYLVPASIIIAGIIIAIAVFFSSSGGGLDLGGGGDTVGSATLQTVANAIDLDEEEFKECLDSGKMASVVLKDEQDALAAGAQGTPFSVVISQSGAMFVIPGALPVDNVKSIIDQALSAKSTDGEKVNIRPIDDKDHLLGEKGAPVKIVEYSDYECPFCKQFHLTMVDIMKTYGEEGKVAWAYRHFPLKQIHPNAQKLAEGAECANELGGQEKFWEYTNAIFGS